MAKLLASGYNVRGRSCYNQISPLIAASAGGHTDILKSLLSAGANLWADSSSAFRIAVVRGHAEAVKTLASARLNIRTISNYTLMAAVASEHAEVVKTLLEPESISSLSLIVR